MFLRGLKLQRFAGKVGRFLLYNVLAILVAILVFNVLSGQGVLKGLIGPIFANSNLVDNNDGSAVHADENAELGEDTGFVEDKASGGDAFDVRVGTTLGADESNKTHKLSMDAISSARPLELIAERQSVPFPIVRLAPSERGPLEKAVAEFLPVWETFTAGEYAAHNQTTSGVIDQNAYRKKLFSVLSPEADVNRIVDRYDSHAPSEVGTCSTCGLGSTWMNLLSPVELMKIRGYKPNNYAFVTTQGMVLYSGNGAGAGQRFRRTYSLLLVPGPGGWKVQRVAADTLTSA